MASPVPLEISIASARRPRLNSRPTHPSLLQLDDVRNREDHLQPIKLLHALGALVVIAAAATPAMAGVPAPVPGPLIGAGAPALALLGGAYYLIRKRRER